MGVYINMEMPKGCYDCTMESICNRWALHDAEWQKENRDKDCPLVPVPEHGRLIDADALREDWLENGENEYVYDTNAFLDSLDGAPTIIPAEEGET